MSKDLRQENHELMQKLRLAESMELAYLEEIEHLKEALQAAQLAKDNSARPESSCEELMQLHERLEQADEKIQTLLEKVTESERQRMALQERLTAAELLLEKSVSEVYSFGFMFPFICFTRRFFINFKLNNRCPYISPFQY
ncbi:unnamed protein product [Echinostoma caproni]|uniref:HAP1 N-terminal domain-containing protein n=1 Tax=Echinostoma caproni TaxID=27848 RepID=A0A183BGV5_9TREM|nr:unnamed protein product [Echinostoma caproni]